MIVAVAVTFRADEIHTLSQGWAQVRSACCDQVSSRAFVRSMNGWPVELSDITTMDAELAATQGFLLAAEPDPSTRSWGGRLALDATLAARDILREAELRINQEER